MMLSLEQNVRRARYELTTIENEYLKTKQKYEDAVEVWKQAVINFETADLKEAIKDGRTTKYRRGFTFNKLTKDQALRIIAKLNIAIEEETEDE